MKYVPKLTHPCPQDWNTMTGDDKQRFCAHCQLHVHNLSAVSHPEQQALISERGQRRCIAYVAGADSIQVRSGTWLLLQRFLRPWRAALAFLVFLLPSLFSGCATPPPTPSSSSPQTHASADAFELPDGKMVAGGIMCEPPIWRRFLLFWKR